MRIHNLFFKKRKTLFLGQSTLEFTFAMVCTVLLSLGLIRVFTWVGLDLMKRRKAHEAVLTDIDVPCGKRAACPLRQVRPTFFYSSPVNAYVASDTLWRSMP